VSDFGFDPPKLRAFVGGMLCRLLRSPVFAPRVRWQGQGTPRPHHAQWVLARGAIWDYDPPRLGIPAPGL
jgi:hypothetical protein